MMKKIIAFMLSVMLALSFTACGSKKSAEEFTLDEVTADQVSVGIHAYDEDLEEDFVYVMFKGPDGNEYGCLIDTYEEDSDITCGVVEKTDNETDDEGIEYNMYDVYDAFTGDEYSFGYSKVDDKTGYIMDASYTGYKGEIISGEEAVKYLKNAQKAVEALAAEMESSEEAE
ncbi:hypothetical protein SAMN06296386_1143 [Lachnospiraceae bacterium]|nr:hypothetical protein SAMN06296386_1143 [Lachnospiraceae bacterium]